MRRSLASFLALITILVPAIAADATPIALPPSWSPDAAWSTDGDFATDVYGDPWDFSNDADVIPTLEVGAQAALGIARLPSGQLSVDTVDGTTVRLVFNWPNVLPWGRDGRNMPINGDRYSRLSFSVVQRRHAGGRGPVPDRRRSPGCPAVRDAAGLERATRST